jgi:SAM-dependent methyltransferase
MFNKILTRLQKHSIALASPTSALVTTASHATAAILDQYVRQAPSHQLALDLFKGEWWSALPDKFGPLQAGAVPLFSDGRITWGDQVIGGFAGKSVLELGPLEGGHSYMIEAAGATSITGIESNARAYMKCLIAKEIVGLQRTRFLYGDFEAYLRETDTRSDVVVASGVLYHLQNPVELIANMARVTDKVLLWTHYYEADKLAAIPHMAPRMKNASPNSHNGFKHTWHRYEYGDFLDTTRFAGGSAHFSNWLSRDDLLAAFKFFGFQNIILGEEDQSNPNGPCILLVASKT